MTEMTRDDINYRLKNPKAAPRIYRVGNNAMPSDVDGAPGWYWTDDEGGTHGPFQTEEGAQESVRRAFVQVEAVPEPSGTSLLDEVITAAWAQDFQRLCLARDAILATPSAAEERCPYCGRDTPHTHFIDRKGYVLHGIVKLPQNWKFDINEVATRARGYVCLMITSPDNRIAQLYSDSRHEMNVLHDLKEALK